MSKSKSQQGSGAGWLLLVPMQRLTIDLTTELHWRVKTGCAREGLKMAGMVREMLEKRFPTAVKPKRKSRLTPGLKRRY
jgi:hypothetical protein